MSKRARNRILAHRFVQGFCGSLPAAVPNPSWGRYWSSHPRYHLKIHSPGDLLVSYARTIVSPKGLAGDPLKMAQATVVGIPSAGNEVLGFGRRPTCCGYPKINGPIISCCRLNPAFILPFLRVSKSPWPYAPANACFQKRGKPPSHRANMSNRV